MTMTIKATSDGLSGELQVAGSPKIRFGADNSGQLAGFRNLLINGDFNIWQRGTSFSSPTTGTYVADRWMQYYSGTAPSYTKDTSVNALLVSGIAGNTSVTVGQQVEAPGNTTGWLGNTTVTFSGQLYSNSVKTFTLEYWNKTVMNGSYFTNRVSFATTTFSHAGTGWMVFSYTITLPAAAVNGVQVNITAPNVVSSQTIGYKNLQLEIGSIATPFEQRPIGLELALCQRYYQVYNMVGFRRYVSNIDRSPINFSVPMRTIPIAGVSGISGSGYQSYSLGVSNANMGYIESQYTGGGTGVVDISAATFTLSAEF